MSALQEPARVTYWLTPSDVQIIRAVLDENPSALADAIRDELSVAGARARSFAMTPHQLSAALGLDPESHPYMFSIEECEYLLALDLPETLARRLS